MQSRFDFNNQDNNRRKGIQNPDNNGSKKGKKAQKEEPQKNFPKAKTLKADKSNKEKNVKKAGTLIFPRRNDISFRIIL